MKYMRSGAEIKRIQREKQLLKEYEEQEEKRRLAFNKASEESRELHFAATKISLLYRCKKAKRLVHEKRFQLTLEKIIALQKKYLQSIVFVQKWFRMFRVRLFLYKKGFKFTPRISKSKRKHKWVSNKGKFISKEEIQAFVKQNVSNRVNILRMGLFYELIDSFSSFQQVLYCSVLKLKISKINIYFNR